MTRARAAKWLVPIALAVLLVLAARHIEWGTVLRTARGAKPGPLVGAALCSLLSLAIKGVRWWLLLGARDARAAARVVRATIAGAALNNLVVAQGGDAARVILVSRSEGRPASDVLAALTVDRALDGVAFCSLLVVAAESLPLPASLVRWRAAALAIVVAAVAAVVVIAARRRREEGASTAPVLGRVGRYVRAVRLAVRSRARVGFVAVATAAAWALQIATYHLVAVSTRLDLPLGGSVAALLAGGVAFLLRVTPGSVGVFQVLYAIGVRPFGVGAAPAIATAILLQAVQMIPTTVIGAALVITAKTRD